jgi:hypothetical protein
MRTMSMLASEPIAANSTREQAGYYPSAFAMHCLGLERYHPLLDCKTYAIILHLL